MNKKAIWAIIGLMSAAMIGLVWLQTDLIRTAIRVNEEKFDKNVHDALYRVAERLEQEERRREVFRYSNGYVISSIQEESSNEGGARLSFSLEQKLSSAGLSPLNIQELKRRLTFDAQGALVCPNCMGKRDNFMHRRIWSMYNQGDDKRPLVERVNLSNLQELIEQELSNRGINTEYKYGVFSKRKKSFVILNDYYVVEESQPNVILPGYKNIYNSKYRVHLFPGTAPSPGLLMIHFPSKSSVVWSSLRLNFLGAVLFTGIILFCFAYTINVIFRQKKLSEMKTDFINNMTHEFKTPIATISLAADSMTSPIITGSPEKVQRFANIIKQENVRMNNQVEKVLQMALIDKEDFQLKLTEVNLHDVIQNAIENIGLQVEKKDGRVSAHLESTKPLIQGDQTHISNVINNLLDNANKYSPEKPDISVHTRNVNGGVEIVVKDSGIGMSKEVRKHIFDKFYRVHTGNLHDVKGFGLGLSYVKAIMTAHRGQVDVRSELGKGSSFILHFPYKVEN